MKCYIASSFDESSTCESVYSILSHRGVEVPDIWWNIRTKDSFKDNTEEEFYSNSIVQAIAARHWNTLKQVDFVIVVSNLEKERSFTGANVEIGFALALGKPVLSIGKLKRSAMYSPVIKCKSFDDLAKAVDCLNLVKR